MAVSGGRAAMKISRRPTLSAKGRARLAHSRRYSSRCVSTSLGKPWRIRIAEGAVVNQSQKGNQRPRLGAERRHGAEPPAPSCTYPAEHGAGGDGPQHTFCGRCGPVHVARASAWAFGVLRDWILKLVRSTSSSGKLYGHIKLNSNYSCKFDYLRRCRCYPMETCTG